MIERLRRDKMSAFMNFLQENGLELAEGKSWTIDIKQKIAQKFDEIAGELAAAKLELDRSKQELTSVREELSNKTRDLDDMNASKDMQLQLNRDTIESLQQEKNELMKKKRDLESDLRNMQIVKKEVDLTANIAGSTKPTLSATTTDSGTTTTSKDANYRLDPNTPVYHARRDENVEQWLAIIQNNFRASGVPEDKKLNVICNYLKEGALSTLINYQRKCVESKTRQSFQEFIALLLQRENVRARKEAKKLELTSLKQTGKIEDYIAKFQEIGSQTDFKDDDLLVFYKNGLQSRVRLEVACKMPKTLEEAIYLSRIIDQETYEAEQIGTKARVNFVRASSKNDEDEVDKSTIRCHKCGKEGHIARGCKSDIRCNYCNKLGHMKRECRKLKEDQSDDEDDSDDKQYDNVVNLCIMGENSISDLLTIDGLVNGKSTHCIFDVGATNSVISFKAAKERNIKIDESRGERVKMVDNEIVEARGRTEELEIEINGHSCKLSLIVLESNDYEILLGMDYCYIMGIVINPRERQVGIGKDTIYLPKIDRKFESNHNEVKQRLNKADVEASVATDEAKDESIIEEFVESDTNTKSNASREIHTIAEIESSNKKDIGSHKCEEFLNLEKLLKPQNGDMEKSGGNFNGMNSDHEEHDKRTRVENWYGLGIDDCVGSTTEIVDKRMENINSNIFTFILNVLRFIILCMMLGNFKKVGSNENGVHHKRMNIAMEDDGKSERNERASHNIYYHLRDSREILHN